jgi:hypothetical protein
MPTSLDMRILVGSTSNLSLSFIKIKTTHYCDLGDALEDFSKSQEGNELIEAVSLGQHAIEEFDILVGSTQSFKTIQLINQSLMIVDLV